MPNKCHIGIILFWDAVLLPAQRILPQVIFGTELWVENVIQGLPQCYVPNMSGLELSSRGSGFRERSGFITLLVLCLSYPPTSTITT